MSDRSAPSILSRGERDVARRLRDGQSVTEIADARDTSAESVEKAIDRVREKTERALITLAESPFSAEFAADLDPKRRNAILEALREPGDVDDTHTADGSDDR